MNIRQLAFILLLGFCCCNTTAFAQTSGTEYFYNSIAYQTSENDGSIDWDSLYEQQRDKMQESNSDIEDATTTEINITPDNDSNEIQQPSIFYQVLFSLASFLIGIGIGALGWTQIIASITTKQKGFLFPIFLWSAIILGIAFTIHYFFSNLIIFYLIGIGITFFLIPNKTKEEWMSEYQESNHTNTLYTIQSSKKITKSIQKYVTYINNIPDNHSPNSLSIYANITRNRLINITPKNDRDKLILQEYRNKKISDFDLNWLLYFSCLIEIDSLCRNAENVKEKNKAVHNNYTAGLLTTIDFEHLLSSYNKK